MSDALHPALRQSLFIVGTDTGVGKTWVATRLIERLAAAGHRVAGMKPVAAGADLTSHGLRNDDALDLAAAGNVRLPYHLTNPVCLSDATSPHLAAERAGIRIDLEAIAQAYDAIRAQSDLIVVEGAGGWFAPTGPAGSSSRCGVEPAPAAARAFPPPVVRGATMADVAVRLGLPVVLVVGIRLGCLSHALLTAEAIARSGLPLAGWIANPIDPAFADTDAYVQSLADRLSSPLLWTAPRVILPGQ